MRNVQIILVSLIFLASGNVRGEELMYNLVKGIIESPPYDGVVHESLRHCPPAGEYDVSGEVIEKGDKHSFPRSKMVISYHEGGRTMVRTLYMPEEKPFYTVISRVRDGEAYLRYTLVGGEAIPLEGSYDPKSNTFTFGGPKSPFKNMEISSWADGKLTIRESTFNGAQIRKQINLVISPIGK